MDDAGDDLLSLRILLRAVEETLADREHDTGLVGDLERLRRLRDELRADLRARAHCE